MTEHEAKSVVDDYLAERRESASNGQVADFGCRAKTCAVCVTSSRSLWHHRPTGERDPIHYREMT
jgi:hypothetical protein